MLFRSKATSHNPRSTVGTVTEIHDYLRLLFARAGTPYCPDHGQALQAQSVTQMVDAVMDLPEDTKLMLLAPIARDRKGEYNETFHQLQAQGFVRFRIGGKIFEYDDLPALKKTEKHDIDVVVDRVKIRLEDISNAAPAGTTTSTPTNTPTITPTSTPASATTLNSTKEPSIGNVAVSQPPLGLRQRLAESFEAALRLAEGRAIALEMDTGVEHSFNAKFACPQCHYTISELEPRLFSFNSPVGACPACEDRKSTRLNSSH